MGARSSRSDRERSKKKRKKSEDAGKTLRRRRVTASSVTAVPQIFLQSYAYASAAVPLTPAGKRLVIGEEAKAYLGKLTGTVGVCTVAGVYRTGKSYLLNQLASAENGGFGVGSSVQACTKGIWICGAPIVAEDGTNIVFIDTEGLGSSERGQDTDAKIFSLGIWLRSRWRPSSMVCL